MSRRNADRGEEGGLRRYLPFMLTGLVAAMLGLSFAAVPLYRIFCQVTGYAGTTQRAEQGATRVLDRTVKVRFDANVARDMPWRFRPAQPAVTVKIGQSVLAHYEAENPTSKPVVGTATFNVTPEAAGGYFNKIECFCFTEQVLQPGQRADMPVTFFIDPEIVNDREARNIKEITLSYTFFRSQAKPDIAAAPEKREKGGS